MKYFGIIFLLLFLSPQANAQNKTYKNLVFEGGGLRGLVYAGVIEVLEKEGYMKDIEKVAGTSVGAITALMVSLNYNSKEIDEIVSDTKFQQFNDGEYIFAGGIHRMNTHYGWYQHGKFAKWLDKIIINKTGNANITFLELHNEGFKDLYVTATSLTQQKLVVFSYENYPNMRVKDAVQTSMSIPLYFEAVFMDSTGTIYEKQVDSIPMDVMVDGGDLGNFPIFVFDSTATDSLGETIRFPNYETLGIRIDSENQIKNDSTNKELAPIAINSLVDYFSAFYILVIEKLNRQKLIPQDWDRTISVSSVGIGQRIKKLTKVQKDMLVESGRRSTRAFLEKKK